MPKESKYLFEFEGFRLNPQEGLLYRHEERLPLPPKVFRTLLVLVENRHHLVTKDELMKAVWPDTFVEESNLTSNIYTLRKTLNGAGREERFIETVPRRGYRFIADVQEVGEAETAPVAEPPALPPPPEAVPKRNWKPAWLAVPVIGLIAGLIVVGFRDASPRSEPALLRLTNNVAADRQPDVSPDGRRIAFVTNRDGGKDEIYVMDSDGSHPRNLTNNAAQDDGPAWSPDGQHIAFTSDRRGPVEIFIMDGDGGHPRPIVLGARPAWSPDGKSLAYNAGIEGHSEIFVISVDGGTPRRLTFDHRFNADAAWSPSGEKLVFTSQDPTSKLEIHMVGVDGSGRATLSAGPWDDSLPSWSPDGKRIAFTSNRDGEQAVFLMEADGSLPHRITEARYHSSEAAWSRDGRWIFFESERDANSEIYRMGAPNSPDGAIRLTNNVADDRHPNWSPDGKSIAFESNRDGRRNIYVMDGDGNGLRNLTRSQVLNQMKNPSQDAQPSWSADGRRIAFSSDRSGSFAIYAMNADGSGVTRVSEGRGDSDPCWSPDGAWLGFTRNEGLWIVPSSGGSSRRLATGKNCSWSPDGQRILFASGNAGPQEVYSIRPEGGDLVCVTRNGRGNGYPGWSRDGLRIAFNSNRDGNGFGVFVMDADGVTQTRITGRNTFDEHPCWSPDGRWIAFDSQRDGNGEIYKIAVRSF